MALEGCYSCLKYLLFVFNFIFWLVGCSLLGVGIWAKVDERSFAALIGNDGIMHTINIAAYAIIVLGTIVTFLGFLGCCGAIRENQCMLATFFIFLFIIFSTLLAIGIFTYIYIRPDPDVLKQEVTKGLANDVRKYNSSLDSRKRLDGLRDEFKCCGAERGDMAKEYGPILAAAYCKEHVASDGCATAVYKQTEDFFKKYLVAFVGIAFGIAIIMLLGMIFSMLLCCAIRETM